MQDKKETGLWRTYFCEMYRLFHKKSFWLTLLLIMGYCALNYLYYAGKFVMGRVDEPLAGSACFVGVNQMSQMRFLRYQEIYIKVFPLLMALPCISAWYEETRKNKNAALSLQRTSPLRFLTAKAMSVFSGNALIVFVSYVLNLLACELTFGEKYETAWSTRFTDAFYMLLDEPSMPRVGYFIMHPILYLFIFCICIAVFSGILGLFAYACSLWLVKSRALVFVIMYGLFYFSMRYPDLLGNFDMNNVLFLGFGWNPNYGKMFIGMNAVLLLLSALLIAARRIKGMELFF